MKAYYMNNSTGEITENHGEAMKWFRDGNEITLYSRDTNGNFIQRTSWVQQRKSPFRGFFIQKKRETIC